MGGIGGPVKVLRGMTRLFGGALALAILVPALYVAGAVVYFPAIVWHRFQPPRGSALMEIRVAAAAEKGEAWRLRQEWVPLESISPNLARAVLAAEDTRFYEHRGFDLEQIREAWKAYRRTGRAGRGASTITQQTVKNLYLSPSRNVLRKVREAVLTGWMEAWLPKDRILELYLNVVELGPGIFGAEAASRAYFGRSAAGLTAGQAALLAATLPAPLARNPAAPTRGLGRRQGMILARMSRWYGIPSGEASVEQGTGPRVVEADPIELPFEEEVAEPPAEGPAAPADAPLDPPDEGEPAAGDPAAGPASADSLDA